MGLLERKVRDKEEMRSKILNSAQKLFLEKGYDKTSIRNIADKIEYSPGTIYLYFKDKNELLFHLHVMAFEKLVKELNGVYPHEKAIDSLEDLGKHYIKFAFENPELYELMFVMAAPMESLECKDEVWDDGMKAYTLLQTVVSDCMNEGYLTDFDVDDASLMIWSFVHGLVTLKSRKRLDMFIDTEDESFLRMMRAFQVFLDNIKRTKI